MIGLLRRVFRPRVRVVHPDQLDEWLATRTAFISQKSTVEYCRARAGIFWDKLFLEEEFKQAMAFCRWEAYAAVLCDVAEACQVFLRRSGVDRVELAPLLAGYGAGALRRHPVPAHRQSWEEVEAQVTAQLARAMLAPPREIHRVGRGSAARVFQVMPIHTSLMKADQEVVENNIRFLLCRVYADLERDAVLPELVPRLHALLDARVQSSAAPPAS